ncbi:2-succinyl-5-enolpyruvyl-6-hydroxy-3-cyclohexene- 1-carboxylic-acid synthase [Brachybacterium rhamnosum]|uniref:2-succinyl-5-enolpyruvyl-6-hydroxy-3-cyclohexene-1-carboxylate synthase n=1 Tax=Brachybacterium rhamnosum TaxID=173361 RepID=A0ABW4PWY0_9MICO
MPALPGPTTIPVPAPTGSGAVDASVTLWRTLAALGVRHVVAAPGSRSAPLVHALHEGDLPELLEAHVRIDERAAAFTALGLSREDPAHPAAVLTTSGTATAHLLAAVMEAHHSRVPLIVLTADRPAELRGTGANQTTRQADLYRDFTRLRADLPAPTADGATATELRTLVSTAARAVAAATGEHPGPVHLNLGFRDPLAPAAPAQRPSPAAEAPGIVLTHRVPAGPPAPVAVPIDPSACVVAGDGAGPAARELAEAQLLPLLAEPSSGARCGSSLVPGYPALLARVMADPAHPLRPRQAIVLGHPTLSRPVIGALLGAADVDVVVVDPHPDFADAARRARLVVPAITAPLPDAAEAARRREHLAAWQEPDPEPESAAAPLPWQARAALAVWSATGEQDVLVLGSSSLVRDLEQHAGPVAGTVLANRGLAGIDGTTSFAGGVALARSASGQGSTGRVRLLVGDLTALHDLTGLVIGPEERRPDLDVVVVDDDGGRIFGGLEHASAPPALLRRFFTTPHGTDLAAAAAALGAESRTLAPEELPAALAAPSCGLRVLIAQEMHSRFQPDSGEAPLH